MGFWDDAILLAVKHSMRRVETLPLLDFPDDVLRQILTQLRSGADLAALRAAGKTTYRLLNTDTLKWLCQDQISTGVLANFQDRNSINVEHPFIRDFRRGSQIMAHGSPAGIFLREYANMSDPIIDASLMTGARTDDPNSFRRASIRGAVSKEALLLSGVVCLDIHCEAKAVQPGVYIAIARLGTYPLVQSMRLKTRMQPKLKSKSKSVDHHIMLEKRLEKSILPVAPISQWVFHEFTIGILDLKAAQDVEFKFYNHNLSTVKSGIVFDAIRLVRQPNQRLQDKANDCRVQ